MDIWIGSGPAASVRLLDGLGWNEARRPRLPLSPNAGPRRTRSRVRAADPLGPGSTETSRGRSRAGTGTRPPARARGRRSCLGRPRGPQHARDRASTRGRLRASDPHRTFPVFEDHHDRGARSPRACDHSRARGQRAKPASPTSRQAGRQFRAVERPCISRRSIVGAIAQAIAEPADVWSARLQAALAVGLLKNRGDTIDADGRSRTTHPRRRSWARDHREARGGGDAGVAGRDPKVRDPRVQPPGQEPGHGRVRRDAQPHRFGLARAPRANLATACRVRGKTPAAVRPTLGAHASASLAIVLSALGYRHLSLSLHPLVESTGRLSCGVGRLAFSPAESRLRLRRPSATYNPEGSNSAPSIGAQALIRL